MGKRKEGEGSKVRVACGRRLSARGGVLSMECGMAMGLVARVVSQCLSVDSTFCSMLGLLRQGNHPM